MGKKGKSNSSINSKKLSKAKSLNLISPFKYEKKNSFIYIIKYFKEYKKFCKSYNDFKLNKEEILYLEENINDLRKSFANNDYDSKSIEVIDFLKEKYFHLKKVEENFSENILLIKNIIENRNKAENITIRKIKNILMTKYNIKISLSTIHRIIKNKLKYRYRKTMIKTKDLEKLNYKIMSFIFIKIILRAMQFNLDFIFIDETNFNLINNNFKTWIKKNDNVHFGPKKKEKINMILAITTNKIINYSLTKENINSENFLKFIENTINKLDKNYLSNCIIIMDNLSVHLTKNVLNYFKDNNIKLMFTVPYESMFNPIELSFRFIKNYIYKRIFTNMNNLKKYIIDIINSKNFSSNLLLNFVETIEKYYIFEKNNESLNLDEKGEIKINNIINK